MCKIVSWMPLCTGKKVYDEMSVANTNMFELVKWDEKEIYKLGPKKMLEEHHRICL
jgi:hypothetical protein